MIKKAYFTSRNQILEWINQLLHLSLTKIQQLGAGNIYCHLLDAAYPYKVPLYKVKWDAYQEIDFIYNFKILQNSFQHFGITKTIDIQKLSKAKYQDNLQFIQWMKCQFEQRIKCNSYYNALQRRNYADINLSLSHKFCANKKNHPHPANSNTYLSGNVNKENHNSSNYHQNMDYNKRERNSFSFIDQKVNKASNSIHHQPSFYNNLKIPIRLINNHGSSNGLKTSRDRMNTQSNFSYLTSRLYTEYIMQAQSEDQCF